MTARIWLRNSIDSLPFALTNAQLRALRDVNADLALTAPWSTDTGGRRLWKDRRSRRWRLLEQRQRIAGGVDAPTELLAEQHFRNFQQWFKPLGLPIALVSGSVGARTRRSALEAIASGEVRIAVGTHALFRKGWTSKHLGVDLS